MSNLGEELGKPFRELFYAVLGIVAGILGLILFGIFRIFENINQEEHGKE